MELHALDQPVFGGLGNFEIAAAKGVVEGYGRGLAADDGDGLCRLRLVLVIGLLRHRIGAGEQVEIDGTVLAGCDRLIDAVAGDRKLDALDLAVLTGFHDVSDALGFRVQLEIEIHGIFRTGGHRLLAGAAPNEHLAHTEVGFLLCGDHHGAGDHALAREGILISAAGDSNAAGREIEIGQGVVGVGQGNAVVVICLIILHRVGLRVALIAGGEARHNIVLGHLLQNPVVALLSGSILQRVIEQVGVNPIGRCKGRRTCSDLLLILPNDALRCVDEIIHIRSRNGRRRTVVPAVHQRHHNSELRSDGQVLKILAVLTAGGIVGVAVVVGHAGLNAVHVMGRAVAVNHQVLIPGNTAAVIRNIEASVIIVEESVASFAVVVVSVRAEILITVGGGAFRAFLSRPCECGRGEHRNDHENGQKCRKQSRALGFKNSIHLDSHPFILIKKKPSAFQQRTSSRIWLSLCEYEVDGV